MEDARRRTVALPAPLAAAPLAFTPTPMLAATVELSIKTCTGALPADEMAVMPLPEFPETTLLTSVTFTPAVLLVPSATTPTRLLSTWTFSRTTLAEPPAAGLIRMPAGGPRDASAMQQLSV